MANNDKMHCWWCRLCIRKKSTTTDTTVYTLNHPYFMWWSMLSISFCSLGDCDIIFEKWQLSATQQSRLSLIRSLCNVHCKQCYSALLAIEALHLKGVNYCWHHSVHSESSALYVVIKAKHRILCFWLPGLSFWKATIFTDPPIVTLTHSSLVKC